MNDIAKRIKMLIDKKELSFRDVEDKTGISRSTIQRYVTGVTEDIPIGKLKIIAEALGTTSEYLMGLEEDPQKEKPFVVFHGGQVCENIQGNHGVIGSAHAPVNIVNGAEGLSDQEDELLLMFRRMSIIKKAKLMVYASDLLSCD